MLLKTVCIEDPQEGMRFFRAGTLDQIRDEVRPTTALLRDTYGVACAGLTGPYAYYRGLMDRPDILEVLWDEGIRFTRTDGRNEHDWHPVRHRPAAVLVRGPRFPDMLEIPIHGWHDCVIRDEVLGWDDLDGYVASVRPDLDRAAAEDTVFSLCQHDWSSIRADPEMTATEPSCGTRRREACGA